MSIEQKKYFFDVLESIHAIEYHIKDIQNIHEFINNITVIDAVKRRLTILGEALNQADKNPSFQPFQVTSKEKIIGLRHILVHDYDKINDETIWLICKNNIPVLKNEMEELLKH